MYYQTPFMGGNMQMYQSVPQQVGTPLIATPMPQQAPMIATPMPPPTPVIATPMPQQAPVIATPMPPQAQVIATPFPQHAFQPMFRPPMPQPMYIAQPGMQFQQMQQPIIYMQPPMPQITEYEDEPQDINIQIVHQKKQKSQKFVHHYFDK